MNLRYVIASFQVGGAQRRMVSIANHLWRDFTFAITSLNGDLEAAKGFDPQVNWKPVNNCVTGRSFPARYLATRAALRNNRPDVLVTNNWGAIEWAAANRPKIVRHIHIEDGFGPEEATQQLKRRVWFRRFALGGPSTLVLPSQTLLKIARDIWRIPEHKIHYIPNGIPCAKFARSADPALTARIRGEGPIIGTVAALRPEKALHRLIEAFAEVRAARPCRLVIVGEGGERASLEARAAALDLGRDVTFIGHLATPEAILPALSVFALSSDTEQMPLTVLEAMASGLPVASVDVGDVRSMVARENQPFVVQKSARDLAGAMGGLLAETGRAETIGRANRDRARAEFDEAKMFSAYDRLFSGVE